MDAEPRIVGEPINRFGFIYAPVNKEGVSAYFAKVAELLQMRIEAVRPSAPHCTALRQTARGWERAELLFAYRSSDLRDGMPELLSCHLIVCWENDAPEFMQEVVELRTVTQELTMTHAPTPTPCPPSSQQAGRAAALRATPLPGLEDYLKRQSDLTRRLSHAVDAGVRALSDTITAKVLRGRRCAGGIAYYTPERQFFCADFLQIGDGLTLSVFTGGKSWEGLNPARSDPWGYCVIRTEADLPRALALAKAAYEARKRVRRRYARGRQFLQ
jgi:hypothetical protein